MKTIIIIGCGPKAIAIAVKVKVLKELGWTVPEIVIIEKSTQGANWDGKHGFTHGKLPLDGPPQKDIGYPYQSYFGPLVDKKMLQYSWDSYLVDVDKFVDWVDKGRLVPTHGEFANYLKWITKKAEIPVIAGEVIKINKNKNSWNVIYKNKKTHEIVGDGLVVTGPGEPYALPISGQKRYVKDTIFNGKTFWQNLDTFTNLKNAKIAVIGGGETAGSTIVGLLDTIDLHSCKIDIFNGHGSIFTRNANYFDNNYFSDPSKWYQLSEEHRLELIKHIESGNFSAWSKNAIDSTYLDSWFGEKVVQMQFGKALGIKVSKEKLELILDVYGEMKKLPYDYIVVALGSNPLSFTTLLSKKPDFGTKLEIERNIQYDLSLKTISPKLYLPMLSGLMQGIGFPLLGCLSLLSDRILEEYVSYNDNVSVSLASKKGKGVFASHDFKKGEVVVVGKPTAVVSKRTDYSFQVDWNKHIDLDAPAHLINHSCDPNTGVKNNRVGGYDFVALKSIKTGEEITWNYETTEYVSISVKKCFCGSQFCRGKTKGFKYLPQEIKQYYGEFIGNYLKGGE